MLRTNATFLRNQLLPAACGEVTAYPFFAQVGVYNAGIVQVWNDTTTLYVKYDMTDGWVLNETNLAVEQALASIPLNGAGGPAVGEFEFSGSHSAVDAYTYSISLSSLGASSGTGLYIAANGKIYRSDPGTRQAWADGTRWLPTGDHWGMHFLYIVSNCQ
jgi:hypothetical protein